jgi:hypothetical protein
VDEKMSRHDLDDIVLSLGLALSDIGAATSAAKSLLGHPSYMKDLLNGERYSLGEALVADYCRPFDKDRRGVRLSGEWPGYERADWLEQHEKLLEIRHKFVSHSQRDTRNIVVTSTDDEGGSNMRVDLLPLFMLPGEAERTLEMCYDLWKRLNEHLGEASRLLITRERKLKPDGQIEVRIPR